MQRKQGGVIYAHVFDGSGLPRYLDGRDTGCETVDLSVAAG